MSDPPSKHVCGRRYEERNRQPDGQTGRVTVTREDVISAGPQGYQDIIPSHSERGAEKIQLGCGMNYPTSMTSPCPTPRLRIVLQHSFFPRILLYMQKAIRTNVHISIPISV
jgi:hypothetical protein